MDERTLLPADERQLNKEKFINPYIDFGFKKLFDQAEIARYSEKERRQYEESRKANSRRSRVNINNGMVYNPIKQRCV